MPVGYGEPMNVVFVLLLLAAVICFGLAAAKLPRAERVNLIALGLLFWALVPLVQRIRGLG